MGGNIVKNVFSIKTGVAIMIAVLFCAIAGFAWSLPAEPSLALKQEGNLMTLRWTEVEGSQEYILYYAPYPNADYINWISMQTLTECSFNLWPGIAFFVAVQAVKDEVGSKYSNIEVLNYPLEKPNDADKIKYLTTYAPRVWLPKDADYMPSSVEFAFTYMERFLNSDGNYWIKTKQELSSPSDDTLPLFKGNLNSAPVYAFWIEKSDGIVDLVYYFFFPYNRGKDVLGKTWGNHVGDWEHITIRLKPIDQKLHPTRVYASAHNFGEQYVWDANVDGAVSSVNSNYSLNVFAKFEDRSLWQFFLKDAKWLTERLIGPGIVDSTPSAIVFTYEQIHIFWKHIDGSLTETSWNGENWVNTRLSSPGVIDSAPSVVNASYRLHVFAKFKDSSLWEFYTDAGKWYPERRVDPGNVDSAPSAVVFTNEQPYVFWKHVDGSLANTYWNGEKWINEKLSTPGIIDSAPSVVNFNYSLHVFAKFDDSSLWQFYSDAGKWHTERLVNPGSVDSAPSAINGHDARIFVFWKHVDNSLRVTYWNVDKWINEELSTPGSVDSTCVPSAIYSGEDDRIHVIWKHVDGFLKDTYWTGQGWETDYPAFDGLAKYTDNSGQEHPAVYAALGSHGIWTQPGEHVYKRIHKSIDLGVKTITLVDEYLVDYTSEGTPWDTWQNIQTYDYNNKKGLGNSTWPIWMSDNFKDPGSGNDPTDPAAGPIYRWGNPNCECGLEICLPSPVNKCYEIFDFGECVLNNGPEGPISKGVWNPNVFE